MACGALQAEEYAMSEAREKAMAAYLELKKAHPHLSLEELTPLWCAKVRSDPELIEAVYESAFDDLRETTTGALYDKTARERRQIGRRRPN